MNDTPSVHGLSPPYRDVAPVNNEDVFRKEANLGVEAEADRGVLVRGKRDREDVVVDRRRQC